VLKTFISYLNVAYDMLISKRNPASSTGYVKFLLCFEIKML